MGGESFDKKDSAHHVSGFGFEEGCGLLRECSWFEENRRMG
jgi:hypothetical protein